MSGGNMRLVKVTERKVRSGWQEYEQRHIPNARFFDLDIARDPLTKYPNMMPHQDDFASYVGHLGINNNDHLVIYDSYGIYSSPRVWWMFRAFGHENVSVLDGGLLKWEQEGRPVESGIVEAEQTAYVSDYQEDMVIEYNDLYAETHDFLYTKQPQILDARPYKRYTGEIPERGAKRDGHITSALSIPHSQLVNPYDGTMIPREDFYKVLRYRNVDLRRPIVTMSRTGITAATINLALANIGKTDGVKLYDGSFTEWASNAKAPTTSFAEY
ncbi:hypothetical protein HK097_003009 [Rhizophlyctis rosea]|uniref:Sulfurtransferase n=1 Tax=Rhizophlyctis rosea TaxID=64517 RepID=A0AAD5X6C3_9FUNG|nr:hypothetical protein HK097_003009 [Rhizophlyctis rosea]